MMLAQEICEIANNTNAAISNLSEISTIILCLFWFQNFLTHMYYPHIVLDLLWVGCNSHLKKVKGKSESRYQPHLIQGLPKNILRFGYLTFQVKLFYNKKIYVTEKSCNFVIEDCLALNCTLKYCCWISKENKVLVKLIEWSIPCCVLSKLIELTVHTSCYWVLDLLCVKCVTSCVQFENIEGLSFGTDILKGGWRTCEKG